MPPRRVIGIDAGGTKLLGGVVDEQLVVHHRVRRTWRGADTRETLEIFIEAVEEIRAAAPDVEAVGFGIPALVDWERGASMWSTHLPLADVPFREVMSERLGLPVYVDNDANAAVLAEHRRGAARGADHVVMVALGTGIGGGLVLGRAALPRQPRRGRRARPHGRGRARPRLPGRLSRARLPRGAGARLRDRARRARRRRSATPTRRSAGGWRRRREISGPLVTELAHDGDEGARAVLERGGAPPGRRPAGLVNAFNPEVVVVGGGAVAAGDLLLDPARAVVAERALPPAREAVRIVPAEFGDEAGMIGAALLALAAGDA